MDRSSEGTSSRRRPAGWLHPAPENDDDDDDVITFERIKKWQIVTRRSWSGSKSSDNNTPQKNDNAALRGNDDSSYSKND